VNGKVTLVHRRLWPALLRLADRFPAERLVVLHEEHTASGRHEVTEQPFADWGDGELEALAADVSEDEALALLPDCLR
jgi:hypothetical protein